jgi:hypothetical protein
MRRGFRLLALVMYAVLCGVRASSAQCDGDLNGDGQVTIDEILRVVNSALMGCAAVEPTPTATPCDQVYTCTCANGCGACGAGGDPGEVRENVSCENANDICLYKDGPCNNPNLSGCDGSHVFVHGWTCVPNP